LVNCDMIAFLPTAGQDKRMQILPETALPRITQSTQTPSRATFDRLDHVIVVTAQSPTERSFRGLPQAKQLRTLLARADADQFVSSRLGNRRGTGVSMARFPSASRFEQLTWARKLVASARAEKPKQVGVYASDLGEESEAAVSAVIAALLAAAFAMPSFKSKPARQWSVTAIRILGLPARIDVNRLNAQALGNNIARWFTALPPNMLTALSYRTALQRLAKDFGLKLAFFDERKLRELGAGAFLAVSQGNADRDAGIARLSYRPSRRQTAELALVGKGILFDTGGTNLKPFEGMLEMHGDMQGSAVALGAIVALATLGVPYGIDAWLAISENRLSATAYKPQDVVTASNGTTIQTIHTDAEGRMVLADTLAIATREQPALIMDFATLTGACVRAVTDRYSGVFSNRPAANAIMRDAGAACGERVWPFPMDNDFDERLRSEIADIKQCSPSGPGDHILAARFLSRFVPDSTPWVHVDLSASNSKDGLGAVPTAVTGFGVALTLELLAEQSPTDLVNRLT
jgi:leucyl aminopeptidase